eukprot:TRINITY_DN43256_c0_g1_i1.p1 TRINITY_DN43256_c0_g1~~TRINITY_DN43256_c0_g1_i1.p1  ORF type:complete len:484 (+),score=104.94 TRINITY_DN43256_c0_g1_i1:25-1452(+)
MPRGFSSFVQSVAAADSTAQKELRVRVAELESQLLSLGVSPVGSHGASAGPVVNFLEEAGLGQYVKCLHADGYDLDTLASMDLKDLKDLGLLPGHALKLKRLLAARQERGWQPSRCFAGSAGGPAGYVDKVPEADASTACHRPGIYRCIHSPRVAIRATPSSTGAVLDTIHPGTLMRVSEIVKGKWARLDDDEIWARWTTSWPRRPRGVDEDGEDVEGIAADSQNTVPTDAYVLIDGAEVGIKGQLIQRLSDVEGDEATWSYKHAMEVRCAEANAVHQRQLASVEVEMRQKFMDCALDYVGVPYHRNCHDPASSKFKPGSKLKNAPLFLDHMQLIQKVVEDMKMDLGFLLITNCKPLHCRRTLPIALEDPADAEPGDLIFYEKLDEHGEPTGNIFHVEIFLGGASGNQSIGSMAWNAHSRTGEKDGVQVFDDYRITSENGKPRNRMHFHSIKTWLLSEEASFAHGLLVYEKLATS